MDKKWLFSNLLGLILVVSGGAASYAVTKSAVDTNAEKITNLEKNVKSNSDGLHNIAYPWLTDKSGYDVRLDHLENQNKITQEKLDKISEDVIKLLVRENK